MCHCRMIPRASRAGKGQRLPAPRCRRDHAASGQVDPVVAPAGPASRPRLSDLTSRALLSAAEHIAVHAGVAAWCRPARSPYPARSTRCPPAAPPTAPAAPKPGGVNHTRPRQRAQRVRERLAMGTAPTTPLQSGPPLPRERTESTAPKPQLPATARTAWPAAATPGKHPAPRLFTRRRRRSREFAATGSSSRT